MTVHYRFHPLYNHRLEVVAWPRQSRNAVTVRGPDGGTLKIPLWMLEPQASQLHLSDHVEFSASVLLALVALLQAHPKVGATTQPEPTDAANDPRSRRRARQPTRADDDARVPSWDDEARGWYVAESDVPGLATEADTLEAMEAKLLAMIPELLELNDPRVGQNSVPFKLIARKQETAYFA